MMQQLNHRVPFVAARLGLRLDAPQVCRMIQQGYTRGLLCL